MEKLGVAIGMAGALASLFFFVVSANTMMGAFAGLVVGMVFDDTFRAISAKFGAADLAPWQIGATLGFVGAFFRGNSVKKADD